MVFESRAKDGNAKGCQAKAKPRTYPPTLCQGYIKTILSLYFWIRRLALV